MAKIVHHADSVPFDYMIFCPGCGCGHGINTRPNIPNGRGGFIDVWTFNGDMEKPTIRASLLVRHVQLPKELERDAEGKYIMGADGRIKGAVDVVCHSFITDGNIQFLNDCTHALRGKTVPLEEF